MKLTKWEHACLDITDGGDRLIIDPGVYSTSLTDLGQITAVVITHIHQDHYDEGKIEAILEQNPSVRIFTTEEVAKAINNPKVTVVRNDTNHKVGNFNLEFFGEQHASIDSSYPPCQNTCVLVNETLYYPGDSLVACPKPYKVLAVPAMAPWLKFNEAVPFIEASPAKEVFPTHNGFINKDGQDLYDRLFGSVAEGVNKKYQFIDVGQTIEL